MSAITTLFDSAAIRYAKLPLRMRESALPWIVISLPVILSSLFGAYLVMPAVIALSAFLLYLATLHTDKFIFTLTNNQARSAVTIPLCAFVSVWGIAVAFAARKEMMLGIVGPYTILLLLSAAPAYRWKTTRLNRRIPLKWSFGAVSILAFSASLFYLLSSLQ